MLVLNWTVQIPSSKYTYLISSNSEYTPPNNLTTSKIVIAFHKQQHYYNLSNYYEIEYFTWKVIKSCQK